MTCRLFWSHISFGSGHAKTVRNALLAFDLQEIAPLPRGNHGVPGSRRYSRPQRMVQRPYQRVAGGEPLQRRDASDQPVRLRAHQSIVKSSTVVSRTVVRGLCAPYRNDAQVAESVKQYAKSICVQRAVEHAFVPFRAELANLSNLPSADAPLRSAVAVEPNVERAGRIVPRPCGLVL